MRLPGFSAENAVYRSRAIYATSSTAHGTKRESVAFARINDRRSDTAGYDPEKGWPVDPWGAFGVTPHEETAPFDISLPFVFCALFVELAFGSFMAESATGCERDGEVTVQDMYGAWHCESPSGRT